MRYWRRRIELFKKYVEQRRTFSEKIKISKSNDPVNEKEKLENYDKKEKTKYIGEVLSIYDSIIVHLKKDEYYEQRRKSTLKKRIIL